MKKITSTSFSFGPMLPKVSSGRSRQIAKLFRLDLNPDSPERSPRRLTMDPLMPGSVTLLSGASGSGKSTLLKRIERACASRFRVVSLSRIRLPCVPVVDCLETRSLEDSLRRLASVGLAEAWTWLRDPRQLSDGQRFRLRIAIALTRLNLVDSRECVDQRPVETSINTHADSQLADGLQAADALTGTDASRPVLLVCDEFAAILDDVSAMLVASLLRKVADQNPQSVSVVVASARSDLMHALKPDIRLICDFGIVRVERARRLTHQ